MSVTVRPYRGRVDTNEWDVDIRLTLPDGTPYRERKRAPMSAKSAAQRWGEAREQHLLVHGRPQVKKEACSTVEAFAPRFVDGHARANRHEPSGIASIESILK